MNKILGRLGLMAIMASLMIFTAQAVNISPGQTLTGSISVQGQMTTYTFAANAGDAVTILIANSTGSLWPLMELHAPGGSLVTSASGPTSAAIQALKLAQTGTYTILCMDGFNGTLTGGYALSLVKNPGPNLNDPDGGAIQPGETKTGTIVLGDLDAFTLTATAGDAVTILMANSTGSLWPAMDLHAPDGSIVKTASGPDSATIEAQKLTQTGTYLLVCRDGFNGTLTGGYTLTLIKNPGPNLGDPDGGAIQPGETKIGTITLGDLDVFTFGARVSDTVTIQMANSSGSLWPQVELHAPDGTVVKSASGPSSAAIQTQKLAQTGTYMILCRDGFNGTLTGSYAVSLICFGCPTQPVLSIGVLNGWAQVTLEGDLGSSYLFQSSLNLTTWSDIGTVATSGGMAQITQPLTGDKRFYRAILKP